MKPIFEFQKVSYAYLGKFPALRDITLTIPAGKMVTLVGANGSGKSTLLQMMDGLLFPDSGTIVFDGRQLASAELEKQDFSKTFRQKVGLVFQNPDIQLFCPTVREDIIFGPLQLGIDEKIVMNRLEELAVALKLTPLLDRAPHQLSIGEKRKVAIASTLAIDPEVLLLDEPTAGLDPMTTASILEILLTANQSGKTIITATHDLHILEEIADTVFVFGQDKTIVAESTPESILKDTDLLQANNLVHFHPHSHKGRMHQHPHQHPDHHEGS